MELYIDEKVRALRELHQDTLRLDRSAVSVREVLEHQARSILDGHSHGNSAVTFHLACWCPQFIGQSTDQIMSATLSLDQAKHTIAREYGYSDWGDVQALDNVGFDVDFEDAVDRVVTGNLQQLCELLEAKPQLAYQTSQHPHSATLLHYIAANGVESHRQITPLNAVKVTRYLIKMGSAVNATANIYGGSTVLALLLTSAHPLSAGVVDDVADVLKQAGAY